MPVFNRTRFAPTPSGFLHLGNVLSFSLTAFLAKQYGAKTLLRIDDMDRERVHAAYVQDIFETLHYLDLPWDEGPRSYEEVESKWSQLQRLSLYENCLNQLREEGLLFACNCSRSMLGAHSETGYPGTCIEKKLPLESPDVNWRLNTSENIPLAIQTINGKTINAILPPSMRHMIVRKKDNMPSYQVTSLCDDLHFGVDLVVRGKDLWDSTCAQLYLASALGDSIFPQTVFMHHALLLSNDEKKLSKSSGDTSIQYLRSEGKTKEDIFAMIGNSIGASSPLNSWEQLAAFVLSR